MSAMDDADGGGQNGRLRLDKFLWAARFYKTRALAAEQIERGRVLINGQAAKPGRAVHVGDLLALHQAGPPVWTRTVRVLALSAQRGPAPRAQTLYQDTEDSLAARDKAAEQRRLAPEPAQALQQGRPTKRERRDLEQARGKRPDWQRWSASIDDA
jgi:ribosome-associated heat shock protein Hsp15